MSGLPCIYSLCAAGALQMDKCRPDGNLNLAAHTLCYCCKDGFLSFITLYYLNILLYCTLFK